MLANPNEDIDPLLCEVSRRLIRARRNLNNALRDLFEAYLVVRHLKTAVKSDIVRQMLNVAAAMDVDDVAQQIISDDNQCVNMRVRTFMADRIPGLPAALERAQANLPTRSNP